MKHFLLLVGLGIFISGCGQIYAIETTTSEEVPEFEYTTQDNKMLSLEGLKE